MEQQKQSMLRLLREIASLCEEASLTGSLEGGARSTAHRYNAILQYFEKDGTAPRGFFQPLGEGSEYAEIGVESRMLLAYVDENGKNKPKNKTDANFLVRLAPFVDSKDLSELVKKYTQQGGHFDPGLLTSLAPFLQSSDLGEIIQKHMDEAILGKQAVPIPAPEPEPPISREIVNTRTSPEGPTLEQLAADLKNPVLTADHRQRIAIMLAELAHEQARLGER
jgi:hypothetical protein